MKDSFEEMRLDGIKLVHLIGRVAQISNIRERIYSRRIRCSCCQSISEILEGEDRHTCCEGLSDADLEEDISAR